MAKRLKQKKDSLVELTRKYSNNPMECVRFFFDMKWPTGFVCKKCGCTHYYFIKRSNVFECRECGHQHYLLSDTIFHKNKMELYKLILGMYLFFSTNKGISAIDLATELDVNYKTALLLARKCRILMAESNSERILDSMFYEADVAYIGSHTKGKCNKGSATEQQPFLILLSTDKENKYPRYAKLFPIPKDSSEYIDRYISKHIVGGYERTLNTDGKTTFYNLQDHIFLVSDKINYEEENHKLKWLNIIAGNIKNNITGIYHGADKRDLPLFLNEQEWRFNHRNTGKNIMNKIKKYLLLSSPCPKRAIITVLNLSQEYFSPV